MFRLKSYAAMFALVIGLLTAFGQTAQGQTIINPSFEVDARPPGNGNGAITGWTGATGINTVTGPLADNGTIPDGQNVAFIYGSGTMRQTVSGFTVGASYRLRYYENARSCCAPRTANLQVTVGGATVVPTHEVVAVGGSNPYVLKISEPFTATAAALEIAFITGGTGDYTVLLDKIEVGRNLLVTNNLDSGAGSLRQTVIDAPAGSTITFSDAVRGAISLTTGGITIDKNLTIQGPGADALIVRSGGFSVNGGVTATISGLTIADGGGIGNSGNLTVTDSVVRSSSNTGISSYGNLTVVNSVLSDNDGGGINTFCPATQVINGSLICSVPIRLTITNSTISHNRSGKGAGINISLTEVVITNSSITGNVASEDPRGFGSGAGIYNEGGKLTITNSTIADNEDKNFSCQSPPCPPGNGGDGIATNGEVNLINATVTNNIVGGPINARNSILNGIGVVISQGYNLIVYPRDNILGDTTGNILGANPRLGPLGYYGGTTMTRALLTGSPAINTGNTATSPNTDQRGAARVGTADIGAFELNNSANGGNFVAQLPDAFTEIVYNHTLVEDTSQNNTLGFTYSLTGGALPTGISLSTTQFLRVLVSGRTAQTGVFAFSVTATDGTNSFVTDYRLRVLPSGAPPYPGGCLSNPVVANSSDSGEGTLRQAVIDACPGGTITFGEAGRGRISLTTGPIAINKNLTIAGPGAGALTIRNGLGKGNQNRVINVNSGVTAVLSGLTISDGYASAGGGISNGGNLTVRNAVIKNNHNPRPGLGGGISSRGTLALVNSTVTGNGDDGTLQGGITQGGGIALFGSSATITDSTVSGNSAGEGGGIYAKSNSSVTITNSTIGDNSAIVDSGGGLYLEGGMATLTNCTVSQNRAGGQNPAGGGILVRDAGTLTLINSTIANNQLYASTADEYPGAGVSNGGVGVFYSGGTVNVRNSIIAGNTRGGTSLNLDFYGTLTSQGYNLIGSNYGAQITGVTTGNIVGTQQAPIGASLGPLAYNGGSTQTHALLTGSRAINTGNTATSPATDQRGAARVGTADIGAFELNNSATFSVQLPDGLVQTPYSYTITPDRGAFTYSLTGGSLPGGISLSTNGAIVSISGTPTAIGVFNFSVTATNGTTSFVTNYSLQIYALPNGNFDSADCSFISGWAWDPQQPNTPISVNIYADENFVATVSANQFRQDLLNAGIGNGAQGFSLATPSNLEDGQPHQIRVLIVSTMFDINGSPKNITCATPRYSISGTVRYGIPDINQAVPVVADVNLNQTGTASGSAISDNLGTYQLSNLLGGNYTVTPSKTGDIKGINSLDATRIQQHLVGMTTLTANQLIAADTDGSGTVNSLDATRIQQRAVGMQTPNIIGQWKFVPASRQYNALGGNQTGQDYQAILVGEVSGNWATAASLANNFQTEENEILPETDNQNQTAERFTNNLSGRIAENTKQSSDSSAKESTIELLAPAADIQVSLPANAMASNGATVTIPITVSQIPAGQSIESFDFSVFYNAAVLQPAATPGSSTGTLSASCSVLPFSPVSGRVVVSGSCVPAITTGSGVLYNLTFNVIGSVNQTTTLSFTDPVSNVNTFQFNNGTPTVATANGLFTVLAPTAASVSVSGRVLTGEGRGLMNATVVLTGSDGNTRTAHTGTSGYFRFDNVEAGQTYIVNVSSKRYSFAPQVITVLEDITELNFTGAATGKVFEQIPKSR